MSKMRNPEPVVSTLWQDIKPGMLAIAPTLAATAAIGCGGMLLASGATPSEPTRFRELMELLESVYAPDLLIEVSHFLSSVLGLVLVLLGFGLRARLGAAWLATVLALFKGFDWEETIILLGVALFLTPVSAAFPRRAQLMRMELSPGWLINAATLILGAIALGYWSFTHSSYGDKAWWRVMADADAERAIRSSAGAAVALVAVGIWRLLATPATPPVVGEDDPEFEKVRAILATTPNMDPESHLALLGDKRFLFSPSGRTFLMFGVRGRAWISLGAPVGDPSERVDLMWRFRELADSHAARVGFYGLTAEDLPDAVDLGLSIQKIGEGAVLALDSFGLSGRKREALRRNWRKVREAGTQFEVLAAPVSAEVIDRLQIISDEWLSRHAGGEKAFSLGGFIPRYVQEFPIAVVRSQNEIVAFATLWTTSDQSSYSMDLMRYGEQAPPNIMDFLFVELLTWGQKQGYEAFDFGTAPLAGLEQRHLAPILSRVGHLVFERGEEIYNFRGVRRYKDKYDPVWRPRYVAAPNVWAIPRILADVGLLSSGGMAGLAKRPKTDSAPVAARPQNLTELHTAT